MNAFSKLLLKLQMKVNETLGLIPGCLDPQADVK